MVHAGTRRRRRWASAAVVCLIATACVVVVVAPPASAAVTPVANPPVTEECGIPVTLVLDASGSISSSHAVETVRNAASVFLNALKDTGSTARVIDFGSVARQTAPATLVTADSLAPGWRARQRAEGVLQPDPAAPARRDGRTPGTAASGHQRRRTTRNSTSTQYTNWDQSLDQAGAQPSDLVVYVTDGDPTAVDSDQPGDPFYVAGKDPPDVRDRHGQRRAACSSRSTARSRRRTRSRPRAPACSRSGSGRAVTQTDSVARLVQIAGPQVVRDTSGGHQPEPGRRGRRARLRRPGRRSCARSSRSSARRR